MPQLIINVREDSLSFLYELLGKFDFVEIVQPVNPAHPKRMRAKSQPKLTERLAKKMTEAKPEKPLTKGQLEFVEGLKQSFHEMELHMQGKIKLPTFQEMLSEL